VKRQLNDSEEESMKQWIKVLIGALLIGFSLLALSGCGGGGGGGTTDSITYNGLTTPAALTQENAQEVTLDAMDGTEAGSILGGANPFLSLNSGVSTPSGLNKLTTALREVNDLVSRLDLKSFPEAGAAATQSVEEVGPCGGTVKGTVNINDTTGAFSASITFANFRDFDSGSVDSCIVGNGTLMNGTLSESGNFDPTMPPDGASMSFTFSAFSVVEGTDSIAMSGTADLTLVSSTQSQLAMTLVARVNQVTFKVVNYVLLETDFGSYQTTAISGRFYNPVHGYVDIETLTALETESFASWPRAGVVRFTGAAGARVTLTFGATSVVGTGSDSQGNAIAFEVVYATM
jgi:hypothetical protein